MTVQRGMGMGVVSGTHGHEVLQHRSTYDLPLFFILPFFIKYLFNLFHSIKPNKANLHFKILKQDLEIPHMPFKRRAPCKQWRKVKLKLRVSTWQTGDDANKPKAKVYLWTLAWLSFKVGCCVELTL
jgi:hypothetical protein